MLNKIFQIPLSFRWSLPINNNTAAIKPNIPDIEWEIINQFKGDGWGKCYFINQNDSKEFQDIIKLILQSQNTINKGDIIYVSKASELPRFKLKEFIKNKGLKKTSRYNYANIMIINKGYIMDLFTSTLAKDKFKNYTFVKEDFIKINSKKLKQERKVKEILNETKDMNLVAMILTNYTNISTSLAKYPAELEKYENSTYQTEGIFLDLYRNEKLKTLLNMLYELRNDIKSGKLKIIFDEDMFIELNKEGIELDEEYLQTLHDMLFSKDQANVKLGFEMMSNLVMSQPTILLISLLLHKLKRIRNFKPSWYIPYNTNLKSLFKLLKTKEIYWESNWKTFGIGLRNNFKTGKEGDIVKKFLLDNINREFKISNTRLAEHETTEVLADIVFMTES
jgi:hypothetical protein